MRRREGQGEGGGERKESKGKREGGRGGFFFMLPHSHTNLDSPLFLHLILLSGSVGFSKLVNEDVSAARR